MKKKEEWTCPFCGSHKLMIETPYMDRITGEHEETFCCAKQKANSKYAKQRYNEFYDKTPMPDDISKL